MSVPVRVNMPSPQVDVFQALISKLPSTKYREALPELSSTIADIFSKATKLGISGSHQVFFDHPKKLLKDGQAYKIHAFSHPEQKKVNIFVSFKKQADDNITNRSSLTLPSNSAKKTFTEVPGTNKIFNTCYQIQFVEGRLKSLQPAAKLSGNYGCSVSDRKLHADKVDVLERELYFHREFIGTPDVCQLIDGARYRGKHKYGNKSEPVEKVVMYQELYDSDLFDALEAGLKEKSKQERLTLAAPLLYRLIRGLGAFEARGIVHGDLKSENIFIKGAKPISAIGDLGHARRKDDLAQSRIGTPGFSAPELYDPLDDTQGMYADRWSAGIVFFELLNKTIPEWFHLTDSRDQCKQLLDSLNFDSKKSLPAFEEILITLNETTESLLKQLEALDAGKIVSFLYPEDYVPSKESDFLCEELHAHLIEYVNFVKIHLHALSKQQIETVRKQISKLDALIGQKCQETWKAMEEAPCPTSHVPQSLDESILYLTWSMLKPNPHQRISPGEALRLLSRFTTENGVITPKKTPIKNPPKSFPFFEQLQKIYEIFLGVH